MKRCGHLLLMDTGHKKIRTAVLRIDRENPCEIIYSRETDSEGFNSGAINDLKLAGQTLRVAAEQAYAATHLKRFNDIWIGHSGAHIRSENFTEEYALPHNHPVTARIEKKLESKADRHIPANHYPLHSYVRSTSIDGIKRINPVGLSGNRIVRQYHIIYTQLSVINNFRRAFQVAGLEPRRFIFNGMASSASVVESEEKYLGCLVIHIGASTCDYIVYQEGTPFFSGSINEGWMRLAKDVAVGIQIPLDKAENLMNSEGSTFEMIDNSEDRPLNAKTLFGDKTRLTRRHLAKIMSAAVDEILGSIRDTLKTKLCRGHLPAGIILTGGGALTNGLIYSVEQAFGGVRARIGTPITSWDNLEYEPSMAPIIGMARIAAEEYFPQPQAESLREFLTQKALAMKSRMFPEPVDKNEPEGQAKE